MNDCYLNFLVSFRALFSLDVGANLVNSKQTIGIILPDLSLLGYAVPVESFGIGLFVILFAYLIIEYNVQLLSHEKFKIAMNMLHTAHTPLILLRNQLEELKTGNLPEPLSQQVEEALGYAECIIYCNRNIATLNKVNKRIPPKTSTVNLELSTYVTSIVNQCRAHANSRQIRLTVGECSDCVSCRINENIMTAALQHLINKMILISESGCCISINVTHTMNSWQLQISNNDQSYGRPYQLPNSTAHNETCANIGNMLFNWRMLEVTGDAKYADLVETCLYNSVLSGISLDGKKYFYTNPLRISADLPYTLRWPKERTEYISCFCCPPNTLRTLCQAQNYAYTLSPEGIYCNLYGANTLTTTWKDKGELALTQETDYPWEGKVRVTLDRVPRKAGTFSLFLRIPEWCEKTTLTVNGQPLQTNTKANSYAEVNRTWKKGDVVELVMDMPVRLLEAHPLAEEIRNQVVVKRGPLVYCLESMDIANGEKIDNVLIPADIKLTPKKITIEGSPIVALEGMARLASATSWEGVLYRPVVQAEKTVNIRLIPYYAWGNRGKGEMTVWMPLAR